MLFRSVQCTKARCGASVGLIYNNGEDPKPLLAERWNRRAPDPQLSDLTVRIGELEGAGQRLVEEMGKLKPADFPTAALTAWDDLRQALAAKAGGMGQ